MVDKQSLALRTKLLGAKMREARLASGKSLRQIAKAIGISSSTLSSYELGNRAISLPDLELYAYYTGVPVRSLLAERANPAADAETFDHDMMRSLRNRVIGTSLRAHRKSAGKTIRELADDVSLPPSRISAYERGERSIPVPELEAIARALGRNVDEYFETEGPVAEWAESQRIVDLSQEMSPNLRRFLSRPNSLPFLELAEQLSELPAEKLRSLAEGLLDISL
jgi:transcriptional regulator with XRE-family HTH domain